MQGTLGLCKLSRGPRKRLSLIDNFAEEKANNQRTSGRPSTTDNNSSLPFSCSLPSRSFYLFAPTRFEDSSTNSSHPISPTRITPRSDPPHRQHVFQSSSFVSSFPNFVPMHYAVRRATSWLNSYNGSVSNPPILYISLIWIFLPGRTTRSTATGAPPLEEEHRSLHVLDNPPVVISTLHSAQQSSQELIVDLRWHHTRTPGSVTWTGTA
jgi:hypothetical protein